MASTAREAILAAVRRATEGTRDVDPAAALSALPRPYRQHGADDAAARLALFAERVGEYGVEVLKSEAPRLPGTIGAWVGARSVRRWVVPPGVPQAWLRDVGQVEVVPDDAPAQDLDRVDAVLTTCAVAVAETGSVVLDAGPGQGRRAASLVPDVHLCVVLASQVVELVPEAVASLAPAVGSGRPITWISGPSATSDIELVRVAGVHGPRTLAVVLVDGS